LYFAALFSKIIGTNIIKLTIPDVDYLIIYVYNTIKHINNQRIKKIKEAVVNQNI
jgi:hypothetical protein